MNCILKLDTMKHYPIVIVDDDNDDCEMLINSFHEIGVLNEFRCFENPVPALEYLKNTTEVPFIIISDINMPKMNGLLFKKAINEDGSIRKRKIPFVFMSTIKENNLVESAYNLSAQGYFEKPNDSNSLKEIATAIIMYWKNSSFNFSSTK